MGPGRGAGAGARRKLVAAAEEGGGGGEGPPGAGGRAGVTWGRGRPPVGGGGKVFVCHVQLWGGGCCVGGCRGRLLLILPSCLL